MLPYNNTQSKLYLKTKKSKKSKKIKKIKKIKKTKKNKKRKPFFFIEYQNYSKLSITFMGVYL